MRVFAPPSNIYSRKEKTSGRCVSPFTASSARRPRLSMTQELEPETLHQRVPLIIGSREDVLTVERFIREARSKAA